MIKPGFLCLSGALLSATALAENTSPLELETIEVQDTLIDETQPAATRDLRRRAGNETLGGYLDALPNVDSASYGEGVGRPVVRGMSGYRVKILQNDNEVSDLSAMSHDHAVAVAPRTSERIELLKGPASLLYAAQAGGVIRISDTLDAPFPEPGLSGELAADGRADPQSHSLDARLALANERWALRLGGLRQQADPYQAGNGDRIKDSDVQTDQGQISLGWRPNTRSEWQLNATRLEKDYGIPNATDEATRINMEREDIGAKLRYLPAAEWLDLITVDVLHSDYLHDETEGGRKDGLFGQKQQRASLNLAWASADWLGETRLSLANSELRVCHEHGACEDFSDATRTGNPLGESVLQYWQNTGLPYSHGHPMPDTESRYLQVSTSAETTLQAGPDFSLGLHWEQRRLSADPDNIQEQWVHPAELDPDYYNNRDDHAASVSAGLSGPASGNRPGWQASVSYIERLPSVDELYWNGFHHATDSYIFGNSDLDKERSVNLDLDLQWELTR
ncbi:MAG: TonB-dependent receptor, partial [Gammaproteobacteria bacterium]|nr:TonB-dependent receptor [Gammaproteobacteria bacterium]